MPVLMRVFPQGLLAHDADLHRNLRMAHEEWEDSQESGRPDRAVHLAWVKFVLQDVLELGDEVIAEGQAIQQTLQTMVPEHNETLRPDLVVVNPPGRPDAGKARLLVQVYPASQNLEKPVSGRTWKAPPDTRMTELLHATNVRMGLVTNGQRWMLVDAPRNETTGYASWYSTLWLEEPITSAPGQQPHGAPSARSVAVPSGQSAGWGTGRITAVELPGARHRADRPRL